MSFNAVALAKDSMGVGASLTAGSSPFERTKGMVCPALRLNQRRGTLNQRHGLMNPRLGLIKPRRGFKYFTLHISEAI